MPTDYKQYNYSGYTYSGGSFASQACGPCSVADIVDVSPLTVAQWLTNNGYSTNGHGTEWDGIPPALSAFNGGGEALGYDMIKYPDPEAITRFKYNIISGRCGVLCMGVGNSTYWTTSGHYIAVVGYQDGQFLVYDPASTVRTGLHSWEDFEGNVKCAYSSSVRWGAAPDTSYTFKVKQIKKGDTGKDVLLLQKLLKSRGLYSGLNSTFNAKTEKALKEYQRWINLHGGDLKVDGICGPATWQNIIGIQGIVDGSTTKITVEQIQTGEVNIYVFLAQQILAAVGYYQGALDMSFGPAMLQSVKDYQAAKGIAVDGIIGPTTWRKLLKL